MTHEQLHPTITSSSPELISPRPIIYETDDFVYHYPIRTFVAKTDLASKTIRNREALVFEAVTQKPNTVATFDNLSQDIWGHPLDESIMRTINVHSHRLSVTLKDFSKKVSIVHVPMTGIYLNDKSKPPSEPQMTFNSGRDSYEPTKQTVHIGDSSVKFTPLENNYLEKLANNIGVPVCKRTLDPRVTADRSMASHICRMNQKLSDSSLQIIGVKEGYILVDVSDAPINE